MNVKFCTDFLLVCFSFLLLISEAVFGTYYENVKIYIFGCLITVALFYLSVPRKKVWAIMCCLLLLSLLYFINTTKNFGGIKYFFYILGIVIVFNALSKLDFKSLRKLIVVLTIASSFFIIITSHMNLFDVPKNTIGSVLVVLFFIAYMNLIGTNILTVPLFLMTFSFGLFFLYIDFRGGIIQIIFFLILIWFLTATKCKFKIYTLYALTVFLTFLIFFSIAFLEDFLFYTGLQDLILSISHRGLNSGRQIIWPISLELIMEKPFFGYGSGFLINEFLDEDWSSHNLYVQVALQIGLSGLFLLYCLFYLIFKKFYALNFLRLKIIGLSYVICLMIFNCFEVTLFQNSMPIALFQWFIIACILDENEINENSTVS